MAEPEQTGPDEALPSDQIEDQNANIEQLQEDYADTTEERMDLMSSMTLTLDNFLVNGEVDAERVKKYASMIPVETLSRLEDARPGILLDVFTDKIDDKSFTVDFRGNGPAESLVGLSWLLKNKHGVRAVEITYPPDKGGHTRVGHRQGLKGSFYDGEGYVEVLNGYKVTVVRELEEDSRAIRRMEERVEATVADFEADKDDPRFSGFMAMLSDEKYANIADTPLDIAKQVVETAANYDVDPNLVMALLKTENGNGGKFFGVLQEGAIGFGTQLELAIRNIKEHEITYRSISRDKPRINGVYTTAFLAYFSEIYSPSEANANHFNNLHSIYFKYRGENPPADIGEMIDAGRKLAHSYSSGLSLSSQVRSPVSQEQITEVLQGGVQITDLVPGATRLSSPFGMRDHPIDHVRKMHQGIDISAPQGTPVKSWKGGTVTFAGLRGGYGNLVIVKHPDKSESRYAHLDGFNVRVGDTVDKGTQVGVIGSTGKSTGPHLHFEIRINGQPVNPIL